ncbi:cell division protein FtsQ/DivIB [Halobacillus sp. ACCC02827]|uniref:cell division protein FtsQ/DivIB n=1 Tax=Halobacillus sp. ACCC02827 TaxID=3052090 RepID=UPI002570E90C|nr:cell division protein FtsQ/DivIB [Halobacillus sp. ACCC02827]WJE17379.1 cell division protein FtsQ/DivIB [Halobacillus sp. ACCC02827]
MEERKVVSIEDRIPKLKQTRRKKANRRLIVYLTILFLLIATVIYLQSPLSNVRNIVVEGNDHVPEEKIMELAKLSTNTNYWKVNDKEAEKNIESHKQVTSATVDRRFPNTVHIDVTEAERIGYVQQDGKYYAILENGTRLDGSDAYPGGDAPILAGFTKETYLKEMSQELKELPSSVSSLISEIHWEPEEGNPYQIRLYMNDGFQVQASIRNFSDKMPAYPSIVSQLEDGAEGVIHIGVGAYFEEFSSSDKEEGPEEEETQTGETAPEEPAIPDEVAPEPEGAPEEADDGEGESESAPGSEQSDQASTIQ